VLLPVAPFLPELIDGAGIRMGMADSGAENRLHFNEFLELVTIDEISRGRQVACGLHYLNWRNPRPVITRLPQFSEIHVEPARSKIKSTQDWRRISPTMALMWRASEANHGSTWQLRVVVHQVKKTNDHCTLATESALTRARARQDAHIFRPKCVVSVATAVMVVSRRLFGRLERSLERRS
jgi:hypothetical protein